MNLKTSFAMAARLIAVGGLALAGGSLAAQGLPRGQAAIDPFLLRGPGSAIGVVVRDANAALIDPLRPASGAAIDEITPDGPAARAGLRRNDIVVMFAGIPVESARHFSRLVQETPPGRAARAIVWRDGKSIQLVITPLEGRLPDSVGDRGRIRASALERRLG